MANRSFSLSVDEFAKKALGNADLVVRQVAINILENIVLRSPVGNPELWAANAHAVSSRETYNLTVDAFNSEINTQRSNFTARGNLKRGIKYARTKSARALAIAYPLQAGKGYVGGRFRANWQVTMNITAGSTIDAVDPDGSFSINSGTARIEQFDVLGNIVYITNNLPYAQRLEDGYSTQAPSGMVGLAAIEFHEYVNKATRELE